MVMAVPPWLRQARSRPLSRILGSGWVQRARTAFIGLLGIVVALGLGLVGFMVNLGFPDFPLSPIPDPPAESRTATGVATAVPPAATRGGRAGSARSRLATRGEATANDTAVAAPPRPERVAAAPEAAVPVSTPASPEDDPSPAAKPRPAAGSEGGAPSRSPGEAGVPARQAQGDGPAPPGQAPAPPDPGKGKGTGKGQAAPAGVPPPHATASSAEDDGPGEGHAFGHDKENGPHGKKAK
jgi:hypothetical protein